MSGEQDTGAAPAPAPSAEQAADLAALQAAATPAAPAAPAPGAPAATGESDKLAAPSDQAMMFAAMILRAVRPLAGYAVPELKAAPDECWAPAIEGTAALLDHYGVGGGEFARTPWGRFAFGMMPLAGFVAVQRLTVEAQVKASEAAGKDSEPRAAGALQLQASAAPAVPGANTVIVGAPVAA